MVGGIVFEHGKFVIAVVINPVTFKIEHSLQLDIHDSGDADEESYLELFTELTLWLRRFNEINHYYNGPKLSGGAPRRVRGRQVNIYDPSNDSKALVKILAPFKTKIKQATPKKSSDVTVAKAAIELMFKLTFQDSSAVWACAVALKGSKGAAFPYSRLKHYLQQQFEYDSKVELIRLMLPPTQRKRLDHSAFLKAQRMWVSPSRKYLEVKNALSEESRSIFDALAAA